MASSNTVRPPSLPATGFTASNSPLPGELASPRCQVVVGGRRSTAGITEAGSCYLGYYKAPGSRIILVNTVTCPREQLCRSEAPERCRGFGRELP